MLARTAGHLFWLSRYMERADYVARLLQAAGHMSAVRVDDNHASEWESAIVASGGKDAYFSAYDVATEARVIHFLALDRNNPSSIVSCIETARRNARSVRTTLTTEMWETVNTTSQELAAFIATPMDADRLAEFLEWVKARVGLFHGVCWNGMLRRDSYYFIRTGQFLERADNTARLLDVKYHVRLPAVGDVGGVVDYYQWLAILRVVGARRAYRVLFKGAVQPAHVAELLIASPVFPRSLVFCYKQITQDLDAIQAQDPLRAAEAKRQANVMYAGLRFASIGAVIEGGLHEYLTDVIDRTQALGVEIAKGHLF